MKRSEEKEVKIWSKTRSGSIVLFGFAIIALMYVAKVSYDFITLQIQNNSLTHLKQEILNENIELTSDNPHLGATDYFSIYVRDNYLYDGEKFVQIGG